MKAEYDLSSAVQLPAITLEPVFVCGGACLNGGCHSRRCSGDYMLMYDISDDDGSDICFVGMRKEARE
ncbi:MAG TPA: hypothetical protein DCS42_15040 [Nitrospiraceae bacterium]|nr:hypothetical protein [Nitrospiraceae bacterium]